MAIAYTALKLVKGIYPIPGDAVNSSPNNPVQVINLLAGGNGFSVIDWIPKFAQMQGNTQANDIGNTLIGYSMQSVTESISLMSTASNPLSRMALVASLVQFARDAREFVVGRHQADPVFLEWHATGAQYPQYALVQNIDIAQDSDAFISSSTATLSITVERESYWQSNSPGIYPACWLKVRGLDASFPLAYGGVTAYGYNRLGTYSTTSSYSETNVVTVPKGMLPGDSKVKAILYAGATTATGASYNDSLIVGVYAKPLKWVTQVQTVYGTLTFNGGSAFSLYYGADTTIAADTGAPMIEDGTQKRGVVSFATTAANASRFVWSTRSSVFRGTFAVFARARVSAAATVKFYVGITLSNPTDPDIVQTSIATVTDLGTGGTGATGEWALVYMGTVSFPASDSPAIHITNLQDIGLNLKLYAQRTSGTGSLYLADVTFMPIDYSSFTLENVGGGNLNTSPIAYDNTGYINRGKSGAVALGYTAGVLMPNPKQVVGIGSPLVLEPNTDNYLITLPYIRATKRSIIVSTNPYTYSYNLFSAPQWLGAQGV